MQVIDPRGLGTYLLHMVKAAEVPLGPLSIFLGRTAVSAMRQAIRFKRDITFAGSALTAPMALTAVCLAKARSYALTFMASIS